MSLRKYLSCKYERARSSRSNAYWESRYADKQCGTRPHRYALKPYSSHLNLARCSPYPFGCQTDSLANTRRIKCHQLSFSCWPVHTAIEMNHWTPIDFDHRVATQAFITMPIDIHYMFPRYNCKDKRIERLSGWCVFCLIYQKRFLILRLSTID